MDRFRLTASIILLYVMLLVEYPIPTIVTSFVLILAFLVIKYVPNLNTSYLFNDNARLERTARLTAIDAAAMYLAPYNNIWGNLKLSNKYCTARLVGNGDKIIVTEKGGASNSKNRKFSILTSKKYSIQHVWNMICLNFDYKTTYFDLAEKSRILFNVPIYENNTQSSIKKSEQVGRNEDTINVDSIKEKIDVNNASEVELTALPGISIVMSKKIIKKREEINGFKNVNEFFVFIKVKPHMEEQLRNLVCVNKMKGSLKIERFKERTIDF